MSPLSPSLLFSQPHAGSHGSKKNQMGGGVKMGGTSMADMAMAEQKRGKKTIQARLGKERGITAC